MLLQKLLYHDLYMSCSVVGISRFDLPGSLEDPSLSPSTYHQGTATQLFNKDVLHIYYIFLNLINNHLLITSGTGPCFLNRFSLASSHVPFSPTMQIVFYTCLPVK